MEQNQMRKDLDADIEKMEQALFPGATPEAVATSTDTAPEVKPEESAGATPAPTQAEFSEEAKQIPAEGEEEATEEATPKKRVSWKNRFTKLKAATDAEKFSTRKQIAELLAKNTELERVLIAANKKVAELTSTKTSVKDLATQEELDILGDEGISSIDKLTRKAVEEATGPLKAQLQAQEEARLKAQQDAANAAASDSYSVFSNNLEKLVPNVHTLNGDPRFLQYLDQPDPMSGFKRLEHLRQAEQSGDVGRVAFYFQEFEKSLPEHKLESKVAPVGNGSAPATTADANAKEVFRLADYNKFVADLSKGRYKGQHKLAKELEAKFDLAFMEGRVV